MQEEQVIEKDIIAEAGVIKEEDSNGVIQISKGVISAIVKKFTLQVEGVIRFQSQSLADSMLDILGKRSSDRSILIDMNEDGAVITVTVIMTFGVEIPAVAHSIQATLRENLEKLTGYKVNKINVNVVDLEEPAPVVAEKPAEEVEVEEKPVEDEQ